MNNLILILYFQLKSDAIFGSAERSETGIDVEIQHDAWGCPYLPGRTLKGLLREQCAEILDNLAIANKLANWEIPAIRLFGKHGSGTQDLVILHFQDAQLNSSVRKKLVSEIEANRVTSQEVLEALTGLRSQTALDGWSGVAREKSLRTARVILRNTSFEAPLFFNADPISNDLHLLAACVRALRRCGTNRNRGTGELMNLQLRDLEGHDRLPEHFGGFAHAIQGGAT